METKKQQSVKEEKAIIYQCPMKCEGSKTYDHEGNCPVCNMKLMPVGGNSSQSKNHCC
jgi:Cu+-exporting ATPase